MYRMRNVPFGMLFSAFETISHRLVCGKQITKEKHLFGHWRVLTLDLQMTLEVCRCWSFYLEDCLWDMTYVVFKSVFIALFSDFTDQSHVPGFAICFVQTSDTQTFGAPAAQWQRARDYAGKGQHLCWSDHLTAGARSMSLPWYPPCRSSVVDCSGDASLSLMIHEIDDWWLSIKYVRIRHPSRQAWGLTTPWFICHL